MEDGLQRVYEGLKRKNPNMPAFDVFRGDMANDENRSRVYEGLTRKNLDLPAFDVFSRDMGFGKGGFWENQVGSVLKKIGIEDTSFPVKHTLPKIDKPGLQKQYDDFLQENKQFIDSYEDAQGLKALRSGHVIGGSTPVNVPLIFRLFVGDKAKEEENEEFVESNKSKYVDVKKRQAYLGHAIDLAKLSEDNTGFNADDSGWKNFWKGAMESGLLKDFATFGLTEMVRLKDIERVAEKREGGERLNSEEESLLQTYGALLEIQKGRPIESIGYGIGQGVKEMIPFLAEFAVTGGVTSGLRAGLKGALKVGAEGAKKQFVRKLGAHAIESVPRSMLAQNRIGVDYEQRRLDNYSVDGDGGVKVSDAPTSAIGDYYRAAASNWTEFFSEDLGGLVKIGRTGVGVVDDAISAIGKRFNKAKSTKVWKWGAQGMEKVGWNGVVGEYVEENVGNVMQAALTGDASLFDSFNMEDQLVLVGSVLAVGGAMRGLQFAGSGVERSVDWMNQERSYGKADRGLGVVGDENADVVRNAVVGSVSIEDAVSVICDVSKGLDEKQRQALLDYTIAGFARKGRLSVVEKELSERTGGFVNNQTGGVQIATDLDGNSFFITGESLDGDKKVYAVSDGNGNVSVKPAREMTDVMLSSKENFMNEYVLRSAVENQENRLTQEQGGGVVPGGAADGDMGGVELGQMLYNGVPVRILEDKIQSDGTVLVKYSNGGEPMRVVAKELAALDGVVGPEASVGDAGEIALLKDGRQCVLAQSEEGLLAYFDDGSCEVVSEEMVSQKLNGEEIPDNIEQSGVVLYPEQVTGQVDPEVIKQEAVKPVGRGYFGNIYDQFRGKAKEAVSFLLSRKEGDAVGVFHRDDLGDIDLVWGSAESNAGLAHIIDKHVERYNDFSSVDEAVGVIDDVVSSGNVLKDKWDKATIEKDGYRVVVRKNVRDDNGNVAEFKNWVVTAFDNTKGKNEKKASPIITRATPNNDTGKDVGSRAVTPREVLSANKDTESAGENQGNGGNSVEQEPVFYEIEKDIVATQQPDGTFSVNKEFTKADLEKGEKFVERMNKEYEDEGMAFELAELPKVNPDNRFEKRRFGVVAREKVKEVVEQPVFSNEEEVSRWVADNSEDVNEILGTYEAVKGLRDDVARSLPRWQQELSGTKIKPGSFYENGDRNHATPELKMGWLSKDGRSVDELAHELSEFGVEVSDQDIVDFMMAHPSGRIRQSDEEVDALGKRFSEVATKMAGMKIGRPDSPTGKLFAEKFKTSENAEQLRQQIEAAQRAEAEVLRSMAEQHEAEQGDESYKPLTEDEIGDIVTEMKDRAEDAPVVELTPENWVKEFGESGVIDTPIGKVKMGDNQYLKLLQNERGRQFGMVRPTLENPDVIIEDKSNALEGDAERGSSYVFVKTFNKNGQKYRFFTSVTVKRDGLEVSISSHLKNEKRIEDLLRKGKLQYRVNGDPQTEHSQPNVSVTTSQTDDAGVSDNKDTEFFGENQEVEENNQGKRIKIKKHS